MNKEERRKERQKRNDVFLKTLDFEEPLAAFKSSTPGERRAKLMSELTCLLLYKRRTEHQEWSRAWIEREYGAPDEVETLDELVRLHYRLHVRYPGYDRETRAFLELKNGNLVAYAIY
jgi:hypothetical protein